MFKDDLPVFSPRLFSSWGLVTSESQPCGAVVDIAVGEDDGGLAIGVHSSVQPAVSKHTAVDQQPKTGEC